MAKLNKKYSELNEKAKKNLIEKYGSKAKAVASHSAARTLEGKKNNPYPSKDEKKAALQIVASDDNKIGRGEANKLLQMGIKPKTINKFVKSNSEVNYSNKAATTISSYAKNPTHAQAALTLTKSGKIITSDDDDDGTGDDTGDDTGGGPGGGPGGNIIPPPNILDDTDPEDLDKKVYGRLMPKLLGKAETYARAFSNKDYLKALKDKATERMKINPKSYGRKSDDALFKKKSLAQKYDTNRNKLLSNLRKPLTDYLDKSVKQDKRGLNMFTKKDGEYKPVFNSKRLKEFSSAGDLGYQTLQRASSLGAKKKSKKRLDGIGNVKNTTSDSFKNKFAQDLQFM